MNKIDWFSVTAALCVLVMTGLWFVTAVTGTDVNLELIAWLISFIGLGIISAILSLRNSI